MSTLIDKSGAPRHLWVISELDFSDELCVDPLNGEWFTLGLWTRSPVSDAQGVESEASRLSVLMPPGSFVEMYGRLESIGNELRGLGRPMQSLASDGRGGNRYEYRSFYEFRIDAHPAEPVVFLVEGSQRSELAINPDLPLFLELELRNEQGRTWWDPRRAIEVMRQRSMEDGTVDDVQIRTKYLRRYLQARQRALVVGHYRHRHLLRPGEDAVAAFVKEDVVLGSPARGAKAVLQNWGLRTHGSEPFLQRRLHLWFAVEPDAVNIEEPWEDHPPFDPSKFTLPTTSGPVAPARWKRFRGSDEATFAGVACDAMDRVYFRQEALQKYQAAAGFEVDDDGSVRCGHYWGLTRSTARIGNELLSTAIVDFAEGVPFEEWPHWQQHAVPRPSDAMATELRGEVEVPAAVDGVMRALQGLNAVAVRLARLGGSASPAALWSGSRDSIAAKQLKWVYTNAATDGEFIKRATLLSTLALDELKPETMRTLIHRYGDRLHEKDDKPLGSRNLLQRLVVVLRIDDAVAPNRAQVPALVAAAEGGASAALDVELVREVRELREQVRDSFAPLAFLYDLRTHGGIAHPPSADKAGEAAASLGLPRSGWHRVHFLELVRRVAASIDEVAAVFDSAMAR